MHIIIHCISTAVASFHFSILFATFHNPIRGHLAQVIIFIKFKYFFQKEKGKWFFNFNAKLDKL